MADKQQHRYDNANPKKIGDTWREILRLAGSSKRFNQHKKTVNRLLTELVDLLQISFDYPLLPDASRQLILNHFKPEEVAQFSAAIRTTEASQLKTTAGIHLRNLTELLAHPARNEARHIIKPTQIKLVVISSDTPAGKAATQHAIARLKQRNPKLSDKQLRQQILVVDSRNDGWFAAKRHCRRLQSKTDTSFHKHTKSLLRAFPNITHVETNQPHGNDRIISMIAYANRHRDKGKQPIKVDVQVTDYLYKDKKHLDPSHFLRALKRISKKDLNDTDCTLQTPEFNVTDKKTGEQTYNPNKKQQLLQLKKWLPNFYNWIKSKGDYNQSEYLSIGEGAIPTQYTSVIKYKTTEKPLRFTDTAEQLENLKQIFPAEKITAQDQASISVKVGKATKNHLILLGDQASEQQLLDCVTARINAYILAGETDEQTVYVYGCENQSIYQQLKQRQAPLTAKGSNLRIVPLTQQSAETMSHNLAFCDTAQIQMNSLLSQQAVATVKRQITAQHNGRSNTPVTKLYAVCDGETLSSSQYSNHKSASVAINNYKKGLRLDANYEIPLSNPTTAVQAILKAEYPDVYTKEKAKTELLSNILQKAVNDYRESHKPKHFLFYKNHSYHLIEEAKQLQQVVKGSADVGYAVGLIATSLAKEIAMGIVLENKGVLSTQNLRTEVDQLYAAQLAQPVAGAAAVA